MEIDITEFVNNEDSSQYSASAMEFGPDAARITWRNACEQAMQTPLLAEEQLDALRDHVRGFGAWEDTEIDAWNATECNALFIQLISGDMREADMDDCEIEDFDWGAYYARDDISPNISQGIDGTIYYRLGY
jgi:hypothetical protein